MTTTLTPLLQTIAPITLTARTGWRGEGTCTVDALGIEWNQNRVDFADLTSVSYSSRSRTLNLIQQRVERRIKLIASTGSLNINLGHRSFGSEHGEEQHGVYTTVTASLHAQVEPRLRAEAIRAIAAGKILGFGPLKLSHDGLEVHHGGERLEWRQLPVAQLEPGLVVVRATIDHDSEPLCVIDMMTPGAVLLPELLAEAAIPFG